MGGAQNHRMRLDDAAMIKDNHVAVAGGIEEAVRRAAAAGIERIIVEVDRIDQIEPALAAGATHLLLDNMDVPTLREAVALVARPGADRGERRRHAGNDPRQGRDRRDLCLGRAAHPIGARRRYRAGFQRDLGRVAGADIFALDHHRRGMMLVEVALDQLEVAAVRAEGEVEQVADQRNRADRGVDPDIRRPSA